jgi:nucleotide-binding universal stress UspA family protein
MFSTVVVGTDGSSTANKAVEAAIEVADRFGARLVIASSYTEMSASERERASRDAPPEMQWAVSEVAAVDTLLEDIVQTAKDRGVETTSAALQGDPAQVLCDVAARESADLLVVGSQGMQRRLLGSVPNSVAHKAPCSVMIVDTA